MRLSASMVSSFNHINCAQTSIRCRTLMVCSSTPITSSTKDLPSSRAHNLAFTLQYSEVLMQFTSTCPFGPGESYTYSELNAFRVITVNTDEYNSSPTVITVPL